MTIPSDNLNSDTKRLVIGSYSLPKLLFSNKGGGRCEIARKLTPSWPMRLPQLRTVLSRLNKEYSSKLSSEKRQKTYNISYQSFVRFQPTYRLLLIFLFLFSKLFQHLPSSVSLQSGILLCRFSSFSPRKASGKIQ